MHREITKLPEVPTLTKTLISHLTDLCFRTDSQLSEDASTIFVFGTAVSFEKAAETVLKAVNRTSPRKIVFSGGMPTYPDSYKVSKPESELLYDLLARSLPKLLEVHLEKTSNNCIENVQHALPFLEGSTRITYITKSFGAGRHYLTLKKFLPKVDYQQLTFDALYPDNPLPLTKEDWHLHPYSASRVWGEFLRIVKYGQRGDIAYDEVKSLVEDIMTETSMRIP